MMVTNLFLKEKGVQNDFFSFVLDDL